MKIITYGTFDLFHNGHARLLKRAKEMGDYLVVGLSTDEFNAQKKKHSVLNYNQRKEILESIKYVDEIIPEKTWRQKSEDIKKYKIDKFVMGDDWRGKFDDLNCIYIPRTKNISTTNILQKEAVNVVKNLEKFGIKVILSSGSLLGAHREGGVIDGDDIDFILPFSAIKTKGTKILNEFKDGGFELLGLRDTVMSFKKGLVKVDLIFYKRWDKDYYYETLYQEKPFALLLPKRFIDELSEIEFLGQQFKCPKDIEGYLEYKYGNWKTPIKDFSFNNFIEKGITKWLKH